MWEPQPPGAAAWSPAASEAEDMGSTVPPSHVVLSGLTHVREGGGFTQVPAAMPSGHTGNSGH